MDSRRDTLMQIQQPISWKKNQQEVGKTVPVLIEQANIGKGQLVGRSARFAPEVDGLVYVEGSSDFPISEVRLGSIVQVVIDSADPYDLYGRVIENYQ